MQIDIDKLTEAELIDLNHRIVARLRFLSQMQAHARMLEFKIGDRSRLAAGRLGRSATPCTRSGRLRRWFT